MIYCVGMGIGMHTASIVLISLSFYGEEDLGSVTTTGIYFSAVHNFSNKHALD